MLVFLHFNLSYIIKKDSLNVYILKIILIVFRCIHKIFMLNKAFIINK